MSEALSAVDPQPSPPNVVTLRTLIEQRLRSGQRFHLAEVVAIVVPICAELAALHAKGEPVYVHPSSIGAGPDGVPRIVPALAKARPSSPRDQAAMAPELAGGSPNPRSSVFGLGAVVYEMLTLKPIGPGMKPPSQLVEGLPPALDAILAKALVADPAQRPDDLPAFAQAIHHLAPSSTEKPPAADETAFEVDIDVRTSLPPDEPAIDVDPLAPVVPQAKPASIRAAHDDPFAAVVDARASQPERTSQNRASEELAALKARLEADPTPRWIVVKDKMDHGPFAALELLQQIASDKFGPDDLLVDTHSGAKVPIKEHPEFSRFAHHANLKREQVAEAKAVVELEKREKTAAGAKTTIGIVAVVALLGVVSLVFWRIQAKRAEDEARRKSEEALQIAGEGSIAGKAKEKPKPAGGGGGGGGGYAGKSYEDALKNTTSDMNAETLSTTECAAPVTGSIAAACGLEGSATAKYVVKNGRAIGITVTTNPPQPGVNSCMAGKIASLSWRSVSGATGCIRTFKVH